MQRSLEEAKSRHEKILRMEIEKASAKAAAAKKELDNKLAKQIKELEMLNKKIEEQQKINYLVELDLCFIQIKKDY